MKVVVDTNIVFSGMLNTNSQIAATLLRPKNEHEYYSTEQLRIEIERHADKLMALSGYTEQEFRRIYSLFVGKIRFIDRQLISRHHYRAALLLTEDVDVDDTEFVALSMSLDAKLWSGDGKLIKGLKRKGWDNFVTARELLGKKD